VALREIYKRGTRPAAGTGSEPRGYHHRDSYSSSRAGNDWFKSAFWSYSTSVPGIVIGLF
jgi:hypothetical protein